MRRSAAITITISVMHWLLLVITCMCFAIPSVLAATIELTGTVRDFSDTHPDFEAFSVEDAGVIDTTLGVDDRPVLLSDGTTTITSQATFAQWYNDVDGVNMSTQYTLVLENTEDEPNVYAFSDTSFFPIDDQLLGNEGRGHNYHFTFMVSAEFTYQGGEVFDFTGDDDVWVFINRTLVVDLGGIHGALSASVDLDAVAASIGIEVGSTYSFHFFSAERRTTGSNCIMSGGMFQSATQDCNSPGYDIDLDGDGWGQCSGDCCDDSATLCASDPSLVNPGAYDFPQNEIDDDCDGTVDNTPVTTCSTTDALSGSPDSAYAAELVEAMDLCQFVSASDEQWGVLSADLLETDGTSATDALQVGVLTQFGSLIDPVENATMAVLSSGKARGVDDPDWTRTTGYTTGNAAATVPTIYTDAHGGELASAAGCPSGSPNVFDSVMLRLQIRVPTNAQGFQFEFRFFSHEYPNSICTEYNDFFIALLTSTHSDIPADTNISFDSSGNPVSVNNAFFTSCEPIECSDSNPCEGTLTCNTDTGFCEGPLGACPDGPADVLSFVQDSEDAGATAWLTTSAPVTPGETITLEFHIWDTQDGSEDSLVLLDNFYWLIDSTTVGTQVLTQECGDGIIHDELGETCDTGGESATCDDDCTAVACGDGNHNAAAGEACDDGTNSNNDACLDASGSNCIVAICGDGYINSAAETCDDSNTTAGDGCTSTCQTQTGYTCTGTPSTCIETPVCGDGVTAGDETCDDGGDSATCDSDCTTPSCGDGYRNPMTGELCDDGNDAVNDACPDGSLGTCLSAACGDGYFYEGQETCEDENNIAGDGCSSLCVIESGYTCTGLPSVCITTCGDGVAAGTEACDDSGDSESCNANCTTSSCGDGYSNAAAGEACDDGNQSLTDACPDGVTFGCQQARCGDGYIYADAEACDDGNALPADGCSESCVVESGFTCTGALSNCITTCGDGIAAGAEPCDDAADSADCNIDCTPATCGDGYVNAAASEVCDDGNNELNDGCPDGPGGTCTLASCGDGIIFFGPEVCDDGNTANYDGCTSGCVPEPGYTCTGEPSLCSAECGDGVVAAGELCDEFFETANCDANCTPVECGDGTLNTIAGETCDDGNAEIHDACPDGPTASCLAATCGDAIIWAGQEICDDGNGFSLDGCSNVCGVENGFVCTGEPSTCWTICGDGIAAGPETCDDGNTTALDGCSDTCALEPGYECEGAPSACNTVCGDSIIVGLEQCDDGGQSATCDLDCSTAVCGDGYRNIDAGELCDDGNSILNDICPDGPNGTCISASCGDGLIQDGSEACDDGGVISSDGCSYQCGIEPGYLCAGEPSTCWTVCGDGIRAGDELCDDGNDNDGDSCLSDCGAPFCGDGNVLNFMEVCDDGNEDLHDGCPDGPLGTCMPAACGDGYIWAGTEGCDDGDATAGDGCSDTCAIETGYTCVSEPSLCTTHCGDGLIAGPEGCDDQGESAACNADCSIATCGDGYINTLAGETCDDGDHNLSDGCPDGPDGSCQTAVCGDGYRSTGSEACDDGNALSGDGCSVACELEMGFVCYGRPSQCMTVCGDGITAGSEECDTTGTSPGCNSNCTLTVCGDGYRNAQAGESCDDGNQDLTDSCPDGDFGNCQTATCGDGYIFGALEVCDDGNVDDDDGCSSTCLVELGYQCLGRPSQCDTICGDGIIAGTEICDHEGGSATCTPSCNPSYCGDEYVNLQAGESCDDGNGVLTDACPDGPLGTCQSAWCGDGYLWAAEELCEDRNELIGDGCSDLCEVEPGWICDDATLLCATVCGDGLIRAAELCDDGGLVNEDGCNITCEVEEGWTCSDEPSLCVEDTAPDTSNGPGDTGEPEDSSSPGSSIPLGSPSDAAEMGGGSQSRGTGIVSELPDPTAPNNVTDPVDTETIAPPSAMADAGLELRGNGSDCSAQGLPPLYWVLALSLMLLRRRRRHEQRR